MDVVHTQSVNRTVNRAVNRTDRQLFSLIIDVHVLSRIRAPSFAGYCRKISYGRKGGKGVLFLPGKFWILSYL